VEAKETRSGKPSSIAWKPAEEMAESFSSRGSDGVPFGKVSRLFCEEFMQEY